MSASCLSFLTSYLLPLPSHKNASLADCDRVVCSHQAGDSHVVHADGLAKVFCPSSPRRMLFVTGFPSKTRIVADRGGKAPWGVHDRSCGAYRADAPCRCVARASRPCVSWASCPRFQDTHTLDTKKQGQDALATRPRNNGHAPGHGSSLAVGPRRRYTFFEKSRSRDVTRRIGLGL
jgi:hypothetical protein